MDLAEAFEQLKVNAVKAASSLNNARADSNSTSHLLRRRAMLAYDALKAANEVALRPLLEPEP